MSSYHLNNPATSFKNNCHPTHLGNLGIIGLSLRQEFSEPKLSQDDIDIIKNSLNEIRGLIEDSGVPADLKISLYKHIDTMIWWLSRPAMLSVQNIFEISGSAMVVAKQIEDRSLNSDEVAAKSVRQYLTKWEVS